MTSVFINLLSFSAPFLTFVVLPQPFLTSKQLLLIIAVIILFSYYAFRLLINGRLTYSTSPLNLPLIVFFLAIVLILLAHPTARLESLLGRGSLYLGAAALIYLVQLGSSDKLRQTFLFTLALASGILALQGLLQLTILHNLNFLPGIMQSRDFTPTGSVFTTMTFLAIGAGVTLINLKSKTSDIFSRIWYGIIGSLSLLSFIAYLTLALSDKNITIFPYRASWMILLEAYKNPITLASGIGFGNFSSFLTAAKPIYLNSTSFWNIIPNSLSSEILHLALTTGIFSTLFFIWIFLAALKNTTEPPFKIALFLSLLSILLFPATPAFILLTALLIGVGVPANIYHVSLAGKLRYLTFTFLFLLTMLLTYGAGKSTLAYYHVYQAGEALKQGDGKKVYEQQLAAVKLLPLLSDYRLSYSKINLTLASTLAGKANLSDEERKQVAALVSQAVREGKAAIELIPNSSLSWQNLGFIYRNLIGVAENADQFAIAAYNQAVVLDPGNPSLRVEYGGLLYQLYQKDNSRTELLSQATQEFKTAIQLKSDYANAYYNLSYALAASGNFQSAYEAMASAVASLDPSSPDLEKATKEMEALKAKIPKTSPTPTPTIDQGQDLSIPTPLPSPMPGGEIPLPSESPTQKP